MCILKKMFGYCIPTVLNSKGDGGGGGGDNPQYFLNSFWEIIGSLSNQLKSKFWCNPDVLIIIDKLICTKRRQKVFEDY
jgi:hypothetical protein